MPAKRPLVLSQGQPVELPITDNPLGVPPGGSAGQVLQKLSGNDYDTAWQSGGTSSLGLELALEHVSFFS